LRFAIFGGTFDPIHSAHVEIARAAAAEFRLDYVLLIPAGNPPHKTNAVQTPFEHRARMAELACAAEPAIRVSRMEEGTGRSYSIHTIERLRSEHPGAEIFFLIGSDAFAEIHTWRRWRDVIALVEFIVVTRPDRPYAKPDGAVIHELTSVRTPVSSSEIRRRLAAGEWPESLPTPVVEYIREHRLYGVPKNRGPS
jgi:nicotinate-nucleotide adenylyltransferase